MKPGIAQYGPIKIQVEFEREDERTFEANLQTYGGLPRPGDEFDVDDNRTEVVLVRWTYEGDDWFPVIIVREKSLIC